MNTVLGPGSECDVVVGGALNRLGFEFGALRNQAKYSERLGGDREGWQSNLFWQRSLGIGQLVGQYQFTNFNDKEVTAFYLKMGSEEERAPPFSLFELRQADQIFWWNCPVLGPAYLS